MTMVALSIFSKIVEKGAWIDGIISGFTGLMGGLWIAAIALGIIGIIYVDTMDLTMPAVVAMILGGLVVQYGPPAMGSAGLLIILLGATLALGRAYLGGTDTGR